ncbi:MAG: mevalonate kinase [Spirochaetota bacterium]
MGIGRGYGKLLLFGEHAAVYGHPAVGIRLEDYLEVEVLGADDARSGGGDRRNDSLNDRERSLVVEALRRLPGWTHENTITVRGTLPMSLGFGSSAAFCTALIRATRPEIGKRELWAEAHRLEQVFHGTPSGIDTGLSVYDGASIIYPSPPELPGRGPADLPRAVLLVGALPRTSTTAELVAGIRALRRRDSESVDRSLDRLGALSRDAASRETCPDARALGAAAREAQEVLRRLGLSTPQLDDALGTLERAGALGAKLSGAGGGGAFYGVFETPETADAAAEALKTRTAQAGLPYLRRIEIGSGTGPS